MRVLVILALFIFTAGNAYSLEPVTALDDGFAVPSRITMTEASLHYPGIESFMTGGYAVLAH